MENWNSILKSTKKLNIIFQELILLAKEMTASSNDHQCCIDIMMLCNDCLEFLDYSKIDHNYIRKFLDGRYLKLLNTMKTYFTKNILLKEHDLFSIKKWKNRNSSTLFLANMLILNTIYHEIRESINNYFIKSYKSKDCLIVDDSSPLWDTTDCKYFEFRSDMSKVRSITRQILEKINLKEENIPKYVLEEQISELIKNAVKHGNKQDNTKNIKIWYYIDDKLFKIIVEDEGQGFQNLEEWNEFNRNRNEAMQSGNTERIFKYIQYKNENSDDIDGGNALFAALEYWDNGLVYNKKKTKVVAVKYLY